MVLLYNIKTHPFFLKRDFSKRLLNDEFQKFWEKKKRKNPVVSHLACTTGFFRLLYQVRDLLLVLHCLHDDLEMITTLQDDILQEV